MAATRPLPPSLSSVVFRHALNSPSIQSALAGCVSGFIATSLLHPFELIKLRFQVHDGIGITAKHFVSPYRSTFNGLRSIISSERGIAALWTGLTPNLLGSATAWGVFFGWYNFIKRKQFHWRTPDKYVSQGYGAESTSVRNLSARQHLLAAMEAGMLTTLITNPIFVIKSRMCIQGQLSALSRASNGFQGDVYSNVFGGLRMLAAREGIRGLYKGLVPALFGVSHGAIHFVIYEDLKRRLHLYKRDPSTWETQSDFETLFMTLFSKTFASVASYPFQVVKARLQIQFGNNNTTQSALSSSSFSRYSSTVDTFLKIWQQEGPRGFYKGLAPNIMRVLPGTCLVFVLYERMTRYLRNQQ